MPPTASARRPSAATKYNLAKQTALIDLLYGQEGETPITDEELTDHLQNQMLYIRYNHRPPVRSVHLRLCGRGPDRPDAGPGQAGRR